LRFHPRFEIADGVIEVTAHHDELHTDGFHGALAEVRPERRRQSIPVFHQQGSELFQLSDAPFVTVIRTAIVQGLHRGDQGRHIEEAVVVVGADGDGRRGGGGGR